MQRFQNMVKRLLPRLVHACASGAARWGMAAKLVRGAKAVSLTSDNIQENPTCRECQRRRPLWATLGHAYTPVRSLIVPV